MGGHVAPRPADKPCDAIRKTVGRLAGVYVISKPLGSQYPRLIVLPDIVYQGAEADGISDLDEQVVQFPRTARLCSWEYG